MRNMAYEGHMPIVDLRREEKLKNKVRLSWEIGESG
jgi:hypothetical protein